MTTIKNKIAISREGIEVTCERGDTTTRDKLAAVYPVHSNRTGTKHAMSLRHIQEVLKQLRGIDDSNIGTAPPSVQAYYFKEKHSRFAVDELLKNGPKLECKVNDNLTLRRHQQLGREIAMHKDRYAFFYDTRTGKTPLSLAIMRDDIVDNPTHKWLVVCPLILIDNAWVEDAEKFIPEIKTLSCHAATAAKRYKLMATPANIYVTNAESFAKYMPKFIEMGFEGCIVDESSLMKSSSAKVSKALVEFSRLVKRFYILSGTPAPNGEYEYYMQLRAIDFYSVPASYSQFKQRYFVNTAYNPQYEQLVLRPDKKDELYNEVIKSVALYVDKEDVLTTPGRTFHEVLFDLPPDTKKFYTKLKNKLYVELSDDVTITAPSSAAKLNKLNQVTSGFLIDTQAIKENKFYPEDNKAEWYMVDEFRFNKLDELLNSEGIRGEQVLIWANYRVEFETIKNRLGDNCGCIYGGTTITEKNEAIRLFKTGKIQYLIANPASADKGLTLTNAHLSIYFSLNWSYELFKQSMERIYGDVSKQPKHCHYYVMMAKGTIDEVLYRDVLQGKGVASTAVLNHLKAEGSMM